ncbi:hypothetical protein BH23GEM8_BH23GEM8_18160 [soil metagenome]
MSAEAKWAIVARGIPGRFLATRSIGLRAPALRIKKLPGTRNQALELHLGFPGLLDRRTLVLQRLPQLRLKCQPLILC